MRAGPRVPTDISEPINNHEDRLAALEEPKAPQRAFLIDGASLARVPAAKYRGCWAWITDLKTLAVSDGTDWIRQDTQGAL